MHASADDLAGRFQQIRELLLTPNAANIARVADCLESLAREVSRALAILKSGSDTSARFFSIVGEETPAVSALLHNAARCYNGLGVVSEAGYERHGLICQAQTSGRALARL